MSHALTLARILSRCDAPRGVLGKIAAAHGSIKGVTALRNDPYTILRDAGASLEVADRVADALKTPLEKRALGHAEWVLSTRAMNMPMLMARLQFSMELPPKTIQRLIAKIMTEQRLVELDGHVMTAATYQKNVDVAREVHRRALPVVSSGLQAAFSAIDDITEHQRAALHAAAKHRLSIVTGGPGCGKSHLVREMVAVVARSKVTAPTGRAARNASGKTVHYFKTIQETGKNDFSGVELIIVDEASMLSTELFWNVLQMAPNDAHIVLVGDVDQLPPIGAGDVLRDLIEAQAVPVTVLEHNFRNQDGIQTFARGILDGAVHITENIEILSCETFEDVINCLPTIPRYLVLTPHNATRVSLNKALQFLHHTHLDIQLDKDFPGAPRGSRGVASVDGSKMSVCAGNNTCFNVTLAAASSLVCIPQSDGLGAEHGCTILPQDVVIVTKNTPDACNGDIGIYVDSGCVKFASETVHIPRVSDADPGMTLAYAVTVHKAQGSEFDAVILPVTNVAAWDRTLLYTAVTRAKTKVYILGSVDDLHMIVKSTRSPRSSHLQTLLKQAT